MKAKTQAQLHHGMGSRQRHVGRDSEGSPSEENDFWRWRYDQEQKIGSGSSKKEQK